MKRKLLLINPISSWKANSKIIFKPFQPLNLAIIAALTPDHWEVEIFDEILEPFSYREADLVGITSYTSSAYRAYQIAEIYNSRGTPVVMGGIHVSQVPEEALRYVNSVVIGEAEGVWSKVISDFESNQLQEIYRGELLPMAGFPFPRRDLLSSRYMMASIQTTRGCPMDCEFCTISAMYGKKYRKRPVEEVLDELEAIPDRRVFFVDDNLIEKGEGSKERALSLFKGMIDRNIKKVWGCQTSINVAEDEEVLYYASKSGCRLMLLGIESEKESSLENLGKKTNVKKLNSYNEIFKLIHKYNIAINGTMIFGIDSDNVEDLYRRVRFINKSRIDAVQPTILTPFPGTKIYERFRDNNRLLFTDYPEDWSRYDWLDVVYKPLRMEREELKEAMVKCWISLGRWSTLILKFIKTLFCTRNLISAVAAFNINNVYRTQYFEAIKKIKKGNNK